MVRLYIENEEVELDKTVTFAITKSFEDLANPTNIKNDWSKTVAIPFTTVNHRIFGHIYSPDKAIVSGSNTYTGIYFDPLKKLDFRLEWDSTVMMTGYAKMNTITLKDGSGTYNITLFGQLGKVFQEMSKITFDETSDDTEYIINGSEYVSEIINKEFVKDSWNSTGLTTMALKKRGTSGYRVHDIIGFAPNNSFVEGFDYTTFQASSNLALKFADYLDNTLSFESTTGISADSVIPNGFLPREYGDFRSYMQLPFIYFNKLFQVFQEKAEAVTGYNFELDNEWFNTGNPYWYNLVYMLKSFNPKNGNTFNNSYTEVNTQYQSYFQYDASGNAYSPSLINDTWHDAGYMTISVNNEGIEILNGDGYLEIPSDSTIKFSSIPVSFSFQNTRNNPPSAEEKQTIFRLNAGVTMMHSPMFQVSLVDANGNTVPNSTRTYGVIYSGYETLSSLLNQLGIDEVVSMPAQVSCAWHSTYSTTLSLPYTKTFTFNDAQTYKLQIKFKWGNTSNTNNIPFAAHTASSEQWLAGYPAPLRLSIASGSTIGVEVTKGVLRSGVNFTLNTLWNNDYNLFEQIINYCKMFRIIIYVDEVNKKIVFTPFTNYFKNYEVLDWTNKIDKSKEFTVTPVTFDTKYVLFNYKDIETKIGKEYKEKFGVNWGEYRLSTDYNFNIDKTDLFKNLKSAVVSTDNLLTYTNLAQKRIVYSFPADILPDNKDKDKKNVDLFGCMLFNIGKTAWTQESALRIPTPYLTDDTAFMKNYSTYFYSLNSISGTISDYYQKLDVVKGDNMCIFNIPKENYTYLNNYSGKHSIYYNLWKEYLDERYNVQNKKVTCYVKLTPSDWCEFKFNKFIKFGNQLYIVNKIYDYDIQETSTTKVDLITVQNLSAYTYNQFLVDLDQLVLHFYATSYINGNTNDTPSVLGTFDTLSDVTFANGSTTYTANGVTFTIQGHSVFYQKTTKYVDKADAVFNVTLRNSHMSDSFHCVRYSVYPYPEIKLYESDGYTERSTIYPGTRNYKLAWYGTETYGIENIPDVSITINGTGSAVIVPSTWEENQCMIAEGDDEWFRTEYVVNFNTNMTNYSGSYVRVTMTDVEGWHETRDFPVSL